MFQENLLNAADHQPSSNTEAVATISAITGVQIEGIMIHFSYDLDPTGGKVQLVEDKAGTPIILSELTVTNKGPGFLPCEGFVSSPGKSLSAVLAAGGSGVTGKVSLAARKL